jgi:hypothetical protein
MNTYRLNEENKHTEQHFIEQIVTSNCYDTSIIKYFNKPGQKRSNNNNKELLAKFTYFGKETRIITKLFTETQIRIAYKVNNTVINAYLPNLKTSTPNNSTKEEGYTASHARTVI